MKNYPNNLPSPPPPVRERLLSSPLLQWGRNNVFLKFHILPTHHLCGWFGSAFSPPFPLEQPVPSPPSLVFPVLSPPPSCVLEVIIMTQDYRFELGSK